jgi:hypothetical protein
MLNDRTITIGAVGFAVLTLAGILLLLGGVAGGDTTNVEAAEWLGDSGNRTRMLVGAYLMCGGAIAFLVFVAGTIGRLRAVESPPALTEVARLSGVAFSICQLVGAIAMAGAAYAVTSGNEPEPIDPGAVRVTTLGLAIWLVPGMLSASAFVAAVSVSAFANKAFPTWIGLTGALCALVLLAAITFLPVVLLLLWIACVGLVVLVRGEAALRLDPGTTRRAA